MMGRLSTESKKRILDVIREEMGLAPGEKFTVYSAANKDYREYHFGFENFMSDGFRANRVFDVLFRGAYYNPVWKLDEEDPVYIVTPVYECGILASTYGYWGENEFHTLRKRNIVFKTEGEAVEEARKRGWREDDWREND